MQTLLWIAVIASVGCVAVALTDLEQWVEFKTKFKKNYTDPAVDAYHFGVFQKSLRQVEEHNAKYKAGEVTFSIKLIHLSDVPEDQWPVLPPLPTRNKLVSDDISEDVGDKPVPESIDWREKGYVTHIKAQGLCWDCWIFAGVAALEALYKRKSGKLEVFSEQNIRDCYPDFNCNTTGDPFYLFQFVATQQNSLIDPEKYYPFGGAPGECKFDKPDAVNTTVVDFKSIVGENDLKTVVGTVGPVTAGIFVNSVLLRAKDNVVYDPNYVKGTKLNHAVLVVGYGTQEEGGDYWLLKSSWGTHLGDQGYFKLARNRDGNLGIGETCSYPV